MSAGCEERRHADLSLSYIRVCGILAAAAAEAAADAAQQKLLMSLFVVVS